MQTKIEITYSNILDVFGLCRSIPSIFAKLGRSCRFSPGAVDLPNGETILFNFSESPMIDPDVFIVLKKARAKKKTQNTTYAVYPPDTRPAVKWECKN